jgi:hypothetical protein
LTIMQPTTKASAIHMALIRACFIAFLPCEFMFVARQGAGGVQCWGVQTFMGKDFVRPASNSPRTLRV